MRLLGKTKGVTAGYPFCLPAALRSAIRPTTSRVLTEAGRSPDLASNVWKHGNVASRAKPLSGLLVIDKMYLLCEMKNKQSAGKSYPPSLLVSAFPPLNFQEFPG